MIIGVSNALLITPPASRRGASAARAHALLVAAFLGWKSSETSLHTARFLLKEPVRAAETAPQAILQILHPYPHSTPELSPTLERAPQAIPT